MGEVMKNIILTALLSVITTVAFANESPTVCVPNDAGGHIILTLEPCQSNLVNKKLFPYHAYATEASGKIHQACYDIPSTAEAKPTPNTKIIPVVNFIDARDSQVITFHAEWFTTTNCPGLI